MTHYRPFSNGEQYGCWTTINCDRCAKTYDNENFQFRCKIDEALTVALFDTGDVSEDIAARMGYLKHKRNWTWPCPELVLV